MTALELETRRLIEKHDFIVETDDEAGKKLNFWVGRCECLLNFIANQLPATAPAPAHYIMFATAEDQQRAATILANAAPPATAGEGQPAPIEPQIADAVAFVQRPRYIGNQGGMRHKQD